MKTLFNSFKTWAMVLLSVAAFGLTSCDNNDDTQDELLKDAIVGTWNVTSYKVAGDEYMGQIFESATLEFEALTGNEGEFEQTVGFTDGESVSIVGEYTVNNEASKITMNYDGDVVIAEVAINNGKLEWDGQQDGYPLIMKADKQ